MEKLLISACLIGSDVKYDGGNNRLPSDILNKLKEKYELVSFCPEVGGGLSIPRNPSEQRGSKVFMDDGREVTNEFLSGARKALTICQNQGIRTALLKERSPSCGVHQIYDGNFNHNKIDGQGVAAELLIKNGIKCFSEEEIDTIL